MEFESNIWEATFDNLLKEREDFQSLLKKRNLEVEIVAISPDPTLLHQSLFSEEEQLEIPESHKSIDRTIFNSTLNILKHADLDKHLDNICYFIKDAYWNLILFEVENERANFLSDIEMLYKNIDKDHYELKMINASPQDDLKLSNKNILLFIKKAIFNGILANESTIAKLSYYQSGSAPKNKNQIYFRVIYDLNIYISKNDNLNNKERFEIIYDVLYSARLLPDRQLKLTTEEAELTDKYRYINTSLENFHKRHPSIDPKGFDDENTIVDFPYFIDQYGFDDEISKSDNIEAKIYKRLEEIEKSI